MPSDADFRTRVNHRSNHRETVHDFKQSSRSSHGSSSYNAKTARTRALCVRRSSPSTIATTCGKAAFLRPVPVLCANCSVRQTYHDSTLRLRSLTISPTEKGQILCSVGHPRLCSGFAYQCLAARSGGLPLGLKTLSVLAKCICTLATARSSACSSSSLLRCLTDRWSSHGRSATLH